MKIEQAKAVPVTLILDKLACIPVRQNNNNAWYLSPLRNEKTASFKVNTQKNVWYDFGEGKGGDTINFVCAYLRNMGEADTVADALRWIDNMAGNISVLQPVIEETVAEDNAQSFVLRKAQQISHRKLVKYINDRAIPLFIAKNYLKELKVYNTKSGKNFFCLGFPNEEAGYELRNQFFKGCLGTKHISFIRGTDAKPQGVHIFEGFFDFLSIAAANNNRPLKDDVIVLNSLSCLKQIVPYIKGYGYSIAYTWMDNDLAGEKGKTSLDDFFHTEKDLRHIPMNKLYAGHEDVNAWFMHKKGLVL